MSSKYDLDSLKKLNRQELNEETDKAQELLFQLCIIQRQILTQIEVGTSRDWMHGYLNEYLSEQEKMMKLLEEMRTELPKVTEELTKQAVVAVSGDMGHSEVSTTVNLSYGHTHQSSYKTANP